MEKLFALMVFFKWLPGRTLRCFATKSMTRLQQSLLLLLCCVGWASTVQAVIPTSERTVLTNLYASTNGASWLTKTNWNGAVGTECTWFGVICNGTQTNVTGLSLYRNNLVGTLPSLSGLTALLGLYVYENQLTGSIPSLSGMTALRSFEVDENRLTGSIPALSGLAALQNFYVTGNLLTGSIPSLNGLTALQNFSAARNQLTGSIPSLSGLTSLQSFYVFQNRLTGSIPSLSGLTALYFFSASINQLTGSIPPLSGLAALYGFNGSQNQLTGSIPPLSGLTALNYFDVGNNQLTGSIPPLSGLTALRIVVINNNLLSGPVPAPPSSLEFSNSNLCTNSLASSGNAVVDAAWVRAQNTFFVTGGNWLACQTSSVLPTCTLTATPASIATGSSSTLTASCSPAATSFAWTGGTCAGTTGANCTVTPLTVGTTIYTVRGSNVGGVSNTASASVTVTPAATAPVCNMIVSPAAITAGRTATLTASCNPAATAFSWTGGSCVGTIGDTCVVTPAVTTTYAVRGSNAVGIGNAASGTVTIVLPIFPLTVTGSITPTVANITANIQFRPQDAATPNNVYVFALAPANLVKNIPSGVLNEHKGPVTRSINTADTPTACVLAQLLNGQLNFATVSTLEAFLKGVLGSQNIAVNVLNGVSTAQVGGAIFYVGYGTDPNMMILNGTNQNAVTVPGSNVCRPETPQSGWWWYPLQDGRGFGIEVQGNTMFMSGYLYDDTGHATWVVAAGKVSIDGSLFSGELYQVENGQTLTGAYKKPTVSTHPGPITLSFTNSRIGTLIWPGGIIPIQRFDTIIGSGNGITPAFVPENGWWWNESESGRGFFMEFKNNFAFIAGYMYEADGRPVWYTAQKAMTTPQTFSGTNWLQIANGQTMTGPYKAPIIINSNVGPVTIQFTDAANATLTLPGGRNVAITRHRF